MAFVRTTLLLAYRRLGIALRISAALSLTPYNVLATSNTLYVKLLVQVDHVAQPKAQG